jgi:hypothetical protein
MRLSPPPPPSEKPGSAPDAIPYVTSNPPCLVLQAHIQPTTDDNEVRVCRDEYRFKALKYYTCTYNPISDHNVCMFIIYLSKQKWMYRCIRNYGRSMHVCNWIFCQKSMRRSNDSLQAAVQHAGYRHMLE